MKASLIILGLVIFGNFAQADSVEFNVGIQVSFCNKNDIPIWACTGETIPTPTEKITIELKDCKTEYGYTACWGSWEKKVTYDNYEFRAHLSVLQFTQAQKTTYTVNGIVEPVNSTVPDAGIFSVRLTSDGKLMNGMKFAGSQLDVSTPGLKKIYTPKFYIGPAQ